jgi:O-antigen ligase
MPGRDAIFASALSYRTELASPVRTIAEGMRAQPSRLGWLFVISVLWAICFYLATQDFRVSGGENFGRLKAKDALSKMEDGSSIRRIGFIVVGLLGAVCLARADLKKPVVHRSLAGALAFCAAWCLISVGWSVAPMVSVRRLFLTLCWFTATYGAARLTRLNDVPWIAVYSSALCLLLGILAEIILGTFRPWTGDYRFSGTMQPNMQAMNCAILIFGSLSLLLREKGHRLLLTSACLGGLACLILTKSRGGAGAMIGSLGILWIATGHHLKRLALTLIAAWFIGLSVIIAGSFLASAASSAAQMGREDSDVTTATGRLPLWIELVGYIEERPLLGHGFGGFWQPEHVDEIARSQSWVATSAHSAYLECLLDVGIPGLIGYVLLMLIAAITALREESRNSTVGTLFMAATILYCILQGFVESSMAVVPQLPTMFVYLSICSLIYEPASAAIPNHSGHQRPRFRTLYGPSLIGSP